MYARYLRDDSRGSSFYQFVEQCCFFGCRQGIIPWLLRNRIPALQGEPYRWHLPIRDSLNGARWGSTDYTRSALIIDLKPTQRGSNLSLYEIVDVWGYSYSGWSPILLRLSGLFIDEVPTTIDRNRFVIKDSDRVEPIYEFLYLAGSVVRGQLDGLWTAPPVSATNAALLFPESLSYFLHCIEKANAEGRCQG